jgi:hypothetical protein
MEDTMETEKKDNIKTEGKEIVFFIDKQQFKTAEAELTVKSLLEDYAKEDSSQTTLVLKHGNETTKYTSLVQTIQLKNGMQFVVYHNTPTTVSSYVRA